MKPNLLYDHHYYYYYYYYRWRVRLCEAASRALWH
tara:strand:- start:319 stop:423 length:105 start_codon:yes stop_codon:yes gene_type:complete